MRGVALSSVCLATWFVTRSLTAQVLRKRTAGQTTNAQTTPTVVKTVESRLAGTSTPAKALLPPGYIALPSPGPIAEFRLKDHQLSLVGNRLKVDTSVEIIDHRAGMFYVWVLTSGPAIRGVPAGPPAIKMVYDQQVFDVAATGQGSPTFSKIIELPGGRHSVEERLYHFVNGEDLSFLDDLHAASTKCVVGGSGIVEVP